MMYFKKLENEFDSVQYDDDWHDYFGSIFDDEGEVARIFTKCWSYTDPFIGEAVCELHKRSFATAFFSNPEEVEAIRRVAREIVHKEKPGCLFIFAEWSLIHMTPEQLRTRFKEEYEREKNVSN